MPLMASNQRASIFMACTFSLVSRERFAGWTNDMAFFGSSGFAGVLRHDNKTGGVAKDNEFNANSPKTGPHISIVFPYSSVTRFTANLPHTPPGSDSLPILHENFFDDKLGDDGLHVRSEFLGAG